MHYGHKVQHFFLHSNYIYLETVSMKNRNENLFSVNCCEILTFYLGEQDVAYGLLLQEKKSQFGRRFHFNQFEDRCLTECRASEERGPKCGKRVKKSVGNSWIKRGRGRRAREQISTNTDQKETGTGQHLLGCH